MFYFEMNSEEKCAAAIVVYIIAKRKNNVTNVESGEHLGQALAKSEKLIWLL